MELPFSRARLITRPRDRKVVAYQAARDLVYTHVHIFGSTVFRVGRGLALHCQIIFRDDPDRTDVAARLAALAEAGALMGAG